MSIRDYIAERYGPEVLLLDPAERYDSCIIGMAQRCGLPPMAVYSTQKIIDILMDEDGMADDEALEYFDYNIAGAYMGESTPLFMESIPE